MAAAVVWSDAISSQSMWMRRGWSVQVVRGGGGAAGCCVDSGRCAVLCFVSLCSLQEDEDKGKAPKAALEDDDEDEKDEL